jgi:DNA invertase Pin-like site-specific DNA recombinase
MQAERLTDSSLPSASAPVDTIEYRRVSTPGQAAEDKSSIADQGVANAALAKRLGRQIGRIFEELGVSGTTADRPEFQRMIAYCEENKRPNNDRGFVFALNDSRFGRFGPDEAAFWRHRLKIAGWIVQFAESDEIEHSGTRAVVRTINAVQSEEYSKNLSRYSKRGKRGAAERGYWVTKAPFGYRRRVVVPAERARDLEDGVPKASDELVKLAIGPDGEAGIVRWMFDSYDSGLHSITTLTRLVKTKATRLKWSRSFVHRVLSNPAYVGDIVGGRIRHDRNADDFAPKREKSEWYITADAHPPLVSRELFDSVQKRLSSQRRQTTPPDKAYALSGIVRCATCDEPYVGGGGGRDPRDKTKVRRFYKDRGGNEPKRCVGSIGTISRHLLEGAIVSAIAEEVGRPDTQIVIAEELDRLIERADGDVPNGAKVAEVATRKLEKWQANLVDGVAKGTLTDDQAAPALSQIRDELAAAKKEHQRLQAAGRVPNRLRVERDNILALAKGFSKNVQTLSGAALRELLIPWIHGATFEKTTRSLTLTMRLVPITAPLLLSTSQGRGSPSPVATEAQNPSWRSPP